MTENHTSTVAPQTQAPKLQQNAQGVPICKQPSDSELVNSIEKTSNNEQIETDWRPKPPQSYTPLSGKPQNCNKRALGFADNKGYQNFEGLVALQFAVGKAYSRLLPVSAFLKTVKTATNVIIY